MIDLEIGQLSAEEAAQLAPHQEGQLLAERAGGGWRVAAAVRPDITAEAVESFRAWATGAVEQLVRVDDPAYLGWYPSARNAGWWYLTAGAYRLPALD